jgi:hypothetical protein
LVIFRSSLTFISFMLAPILAPSIHEAVTRRSQCFIIIHLMGSTLMMYDSRGPVLHSTPVVTRRIDYKSVSDWWSDLWVYTPQFSIAYRYTNLYGRVFTAVALAHLPLTSVTERFLAPSTNCK